MNHLRRPSATCRTAAPRAALLLTAGLLTTGLLTTGLLAGCDGDTTSSATPQDPARVAADLESLTNAARTDQGLPPYEHSDCAASAATDRAAALVGKDELTHADLTAVMLGCQVSVAGENLSRSAKPASDVVEAWLGSSGHRSNILDEQYTGMGVGCVPDGEEALCSLVFVAK